MQNLLEIFKSIGNISPENEKELFNAIQRVEVPAKTVLQEQDKTSNKIYFVEKGSARTFYYKDGKDITYWNPEFCLKRDMNATIWILQGLIAFVFLFSGFHKAYFDEKRKVYLNGSLSLLVFLNFWEQQA